jgi:hypothetical protein
MDESTSPEVVGPTSHAHRLFVWGVIISVTYVGGLAIYAAFVWPLMLEMKPAEFAEFLAGAFAPLAFLWLVLGFRQQGDELQNSARALWLQGEELRNSVEQQRALVEVTREQLESEYEARRTAEKQEELAAQPALHVAPGGGYHSAGKSVVKIQLHSAGPVCTDVLATMTGQRAQTKAVFAAGETLDWEFQFVAADPEQVLDLAVEYTDRRGGRRRQVFQMGVHKYPDGAQTFISNAVRLRTEAA